MIFAPIVFALLMPEAALYYGLLMAKVAPDTALIPFAVAMLWSLVRLNESGDGRWWLAAGLFAGLALLSKFTAIMLLPAVVAFMLVPDWRWRWLLQPYPWLAALIAVAVFSPVLIWNFQHDWASFRFQAVRAVGDASVFAAHGRRVLRPAIRPGRLRAAAGGAVGRDADGVARLSHPRAGRDPALDRGDRAVRLFLLEVADVAGRRHLADVPVARRLCRHRDQIAMLPREGWPDWMVKSTIGWARIAIISGIAFVVGVFLYYVAAPWNLIGRDRSGRRRGRL